MTRWEYRQLEGQARNLDALVDALDFLGQDGWELVTLVKISKPADAVACVLKRPLPEPSRSRSTDVTRR